MTLKGSKMLVFRNNKTSTCHYRVQLKKRKLRKTYPLMVRILTDYINLKNAFKTIRASKQYRNQLRIVSMNFQR